MTAAADSSTLHAVREAWQAGDAVGAEARCRALLASNPRHVAGQVMLGVILRRSNPAAAETALSCALELQPGNVDAAFHLGNLHREQAQYAQAIAAYETARAGKPDHPSILNNLALAHEGAGHIERALASYDALLQSHPDHRQALGNLVHLYCRLHRFHDACEAAGRYLQRFPEGDARLWSDYGICLHHAGNHAAAEQCFRRTLALDPDDIVAKVNLGSVFIDREAYEDANAILSAAVANGAESAYATSLLAYSRAQLCDWTELGALHASVRVKIAAGDDAVNAFAALSMRLTNADQLRIARRWANDLQDPSMIEHRPATSRASSKIRLGYVSSDFRTHPTTFLLAEVWERHDRDRVETFAYSIGPDEASALRARVERAFDHFRDCAQDSVMATAERIRDDRVDVLIDLNGYTTHARSEIFLTRPAPVQLQWLGYLGTLGSTHIDYVLTDRFITPEDQQPFFTERFLYLPHCFSPSDTRRTVAATKTTRVENGLPEQGFVFCCFNNAYKISPDVFDVWMRLLAAVRDSVLWLSPPRTTAAANLRHAASARGIDPDRLVFAPRVASPEHLARHVHADLFLDTMPYNAGATANDALWMGLPLLTCASDTMAGRVAASELRAIGLGDMVTNNLSQYEDRALTLARDRQLLHDIRERLAANRAAYPLFDMQRFTRDLENLLEEALRRHTSVATSATNTS